MKSLVVIFVISLIPSSLQKFVIPDVAIQAIKPRGIVVSLPDSDGIQHFAFHGNVNNPIKGKEEGSISKNAGRAVNGFWQIKDENVELKVGDVVHYWVFVQHNRLGFDKQEQKFTVAALVDDGTPPALSTGFTGPCTLSVTTINGGQSVCGGTVIFEDQFDTMDETKWTKQYYIADRPDFEFVTYEHQNVIIQNGFLNLKATLRPNVESIDHLDFTNGCTGNTCKKKIRGFLLPPVIAGQLKSKFSFRYGKIEVKAHLPKGDWVYPQLYLESPVSTDVYNNNGRIWLAYSRGNQDLRTSIQEQIGNPVLFSGPCLSDTEPQRTSGTKVFHMQGQRKWSDDIHTFVFTWKPDGMSISVDGDQMTMPNSASKFNKELLVTLGIAAGGSSDFPDDSYSGTNRKPWRRLAVQSTRAFYEAKDDWLPTWPNNEATLRIDSIKIWSL